MLSQRKKQHLQYLYRGGGVPSVLAWFVRACLSLLYYREGRYILAKRVPEQSPPDSGKKGKVTDVGCLTLESLEALREVEQELPPSFTHSPKSFRTHLEGRGIIILVFGPQEDGTERKVVAYTLYQRGVLSIL
jgi:hypothetical protein